VGRDPPFDRETILTRVEVMTAVLSEVDRLSRVAVKHPRDAFIDQQTIARQWQELRFTGAPDLDRAPASTICSSRH
jgi:hypothetical protein